MKLGKGVMTAEVMRPDFRIIKYDEEEDESLGEISCIAYARHSTEGQLGSCDDQLRRIRREFQLGNIKSLRFPNAKLVLAYELKDEAVSGFDSQKEQFLVARSLYRQRKARVIVVLKMDRTSRNMIVSLEFHDDLQEHDAELISIGDRFSSCQPGARIQFMEKAYHSEQFLENVSTDTQRGLNERRMEGFSDGHLWLGVGSKPTRQIMVKGREKDSYFDYYIIPHLADLVRRIFVMARDGHSQKEIAKILNTERVPSPGLYNKEGNVRAEGRRNLVWRDRTIWQILNNKSYIGIIERGKTKQVKRADGTRQTIEIPKSQWLVIERPDLRIIPQDLWEGVRERFRDYNVRRLKKVGDGKPFRHDGTTNHVLTGLCSCAVCGGPVVVVSGRKGGYYGCRNSHRQHTCENRKVISWKKFELPILKFITDQIKSDDVCRVLSAKYNEFRKTRIHTDVGDLGTAAAKLDEVSLAIENIVKAIEQGAAPESLMQRLVTLEKEKQSLANKINFLQGVDQSEIYVTPGAIKMRFEEIPKLLHQSQPFEVNRALKPILGKGGIKLEWRGTCYWAVGAINIGRAMGLADNESAMDAATVSLEVPVELELG